jgi:hypothetical protein
MDCVEVSQKLLVDEGSADPEMDQHVAECVACTRIARGLARLDSVLGATLIVVPPLGLQQRLQQLAMEAAQPAIVPWWQQVLHFNLTRWLAQRPQMIAAQGLAAVMLALASWQVFGWLSAFQPVVGDVAYAVELVAASPAVAYLGSMQIDFQSLGIWSVVGIAGWLISENGVIGRRIASSGLRLP